MVDDPCRVLVDTFVNKIFLYDDKIVFTFNYKSDTKEVTLKEIEVSDIFLGGEPVKIQTSKWMSVFLFISWTRTYFIIYIIIIKALIGLYQSELFCGKLMELSLI